LDLICDAKKMKPESRKDELLCTVPKFELTSISGGLGTCRRFMPRKRWYQIEDLSVKGFPVTPSVVARKPSSSKSLEYALC